MTVQTGAFPRIKDISIVRESLNFSSNEFSLELLPADPLATAKGTFPLWILKASEIPKEERFIFAVIDKVTGAIDPQYEFEASETGQLTIFDRKGIHFESEVPFVESRPWPAGSPIQYAVVSKTHYTTAIAEFVPYPIEAESPTGGKISLEVAHPMGTRFDLTASHFAPEEKVRIVHTVGERTEEMEIAADENGSFSLPLKAAVFGRLGGDASIAAIGEHQTIRLVYPWGARLEKQAFEQKTVFPILFVANREEIDRGEIEREFTASFFR